ncbi:MAG: response regulator [Gemmatimonadota bacterium]|nr:response regulator [Gemmatimonadota bacterium]
MPDQAEFPRTPLVLVTIDQEWTVRSLESILSPAGYAVVKARNGEEAQDLLKRVSPDLILVDNELPDMAGTALIQSIRARSAALQTAPIVLLTMDALNREQRIDALRAGAWEIVRAPFDQEELTLKLQAFVMMKLRADEAREESLVDDRSGFYNVQGLMKRVSELTADAARNRRSLACLVVAPDLSAGIQAGMVDEPERIGNEMATALASVTRISDTVGRLGETEFVVIAPGTTPESADDFAQRLLSRLAASEQVGRHFAGQALRAGYYAVAEQDAETVMPVDILTRATLALRRAQAGEGGPSIQAFRN